MNKGKNTFKLLLFKKGEKVTYELMKLDDSRKSVNGHVSELFGKRKKNLNHCSYFRVFVIWVVK